MPTSPQLAALIRRQGGVVSRRQLIAFGVSGSSVDWNLRKQRWTPLLPAVYLTTGGAPSERQRAWAATLWGGPDAQLTGVFAMRVYGVRIPAADSPMVLIPHARRSRHAPGVVVRRAHYLPAPRQLQGLALAPLPRATLDACLGIADLSTVRATLAAPVQQRRCTPQQLLSSAVDAGGRQSGLLRAGLDEILAGIRSAPEGAVRAVIAASRLPVPLWNPTLWTPDGEFVACPDGFWEEAGVALEMESMEYHFNARYWRQTLRRRSLMAAHGILTVQCPPSRLADEAPGLIDELERAIGAGLARPRLPLIVRTARVA